MEVTKWLKPSDSASRIGDGASVQAATQVNAEQASKRTMRRPTRRLSLPKIPSGRIRVVRQNQRIIRCAACDRPFTGNGYRHSVQVAAPA